MAKAGARVRTMARRYLPVTASPESANFVHSQNAREGDARRLAGLAFDRIGWLYPANMEHREYHFFTRAQRSYIQNRHRISFTLTAGITHIHDAGAIPSIDIFSPLIVWAIGVTHSHS
jgi:hypothetical protein